MVVDYEILVSALIILLTLRLISDALRQEKRVTALEAENRALLATVLSLSGKPQAAELLQRFHGDQTSDFERLENVPQRQGSKPLGL